MLHSRSAQRYGMYLARKGRTVLGAGRSLQYRERLRAQALDSHDRIPFPETFYPRRHSTFSPIAILTAQL